MIDAHLRSIEAGADYLDKMIGAAERAIANAKPPDIVARRPGDANAAAGDLAMETVSILRGDGVTPEAIRWMWSDWIARGKLHILAGAAGTGKTTLALAMGATITTGGRWPDGTRAQIGDVLIWSGEDDPADTLVPRLLAMGADLSHIHFVGNVNDERGLRAFDPATDVRLLSERFADCGSVALLIVDPIVSAITGDSHKNSEVRRNLQPLVDLAALRSCALIGITHYSKGTAGRDPLERVTGSLAFGALARIVMGTAKPTEAGEPRRLVRAKSNIGPDGGGFEYDLEQVAVPGRPGLFGSRVLWGSAIQGTARDLLAAVETDPDDNNERGATEEAADWLRDRLLPGPVPAGEIKREGERNGFAWRTVQRARETVGAVSTRHGFGKGSTVNWSLSADSPIDATAQSIDAESAGHNSLAPMDDLAPMERVPGGNGAETILNPGTIDAKNVIDAKPECSAPVGTYGADGVFEVEI